MNNSDLILATLKPQQQMDFLLSILENSEEIILFSIDLNENFLFFNKRYQSLIYENYGIEIKVGDCILDNYLEQEKKDEIKRLIKQIKNGEKISQVLTCAGKNGGYPSDWINRWSPISDKDGKIVGILCIGIDETEKNQAKKKLFEEREGLKLSEMLGYHDPLTGLYNRRYAEDQLMKIDQEKYLPISIVMADINGLELINESFDRATGDQTIVKTAEVLRKNCASGASVTRYGNDEFVMILPETDSETAKALISRIIEELKHEKIKGVIDFSVSFGFDTKNTIGENLNNTLKNAEDRLYREKLREGTSKSQTIKRVLEMLFNKNAGEKEHSIRVGEISGKIAELICQDPLFIEQTIRAGELHDIGKITVDEKSLNKLKTLENSDWTDIKRHPERGFRLLNLVDEYKDIAEIVYQHQERWDGTGYPRGLKEKEIELQARIISIAEAYEVMMRKYTKQEVIEELKKCSGTQFDPELVDVFIKNI